MIIAGSSNGSQRLRRGLAKGDETTDFGSYMYKTYILKSLTENYYYIGHSENVEKRLNEHNTRKNRSTKAYAPFKIIYQEAFQTKGEAFKREQQIKKYKHGEAFKKLIGV